MDKLGSIIKSTLMIVMRSKLVLRLALVFTTDRQTDRAGYRAAGHSKKWSEPGVETGDCVLTVIWGLLLLYIASKYSLGLSRVPLGNLLGWGSRDSAQLHRLLWGHVDGHQQEVCVTSEKERDRKSQPSTRTLQQHLTY